MELSRARAVSSVPVLYFDVESELPFRPEVVWAQLTYPETYALWLEGLREVEPTSVLTRGSEITLALEVGEKGGASGHVRKMSFDITAFLSPKERAGLLAFEGRLVPEGLVLGSIKVAPTPIGTKLSVSLEIAHGHVIQELFSRPFGVVVGGRENGLRDMFERGLVSFRKALEARASDPYRGRT